MTYADSLCGIAALIGVEEGSIVRSLDLPSVVHAVLCSMLEIGRIQRRDTKRNRVAGEQNTSGDSAAPSFMGCSVAFYGMHLLVGCVLSRSDCLQALANFPHFRVWLKYYVLQVCSPSTSHPCYPS